MMDPSEEIQRAYQLMMPISLAWLKRLKELGVSVDGLCEPHLPVQAKIALHGDCFDFDGGEQATDALVFLGHDDRGEPADFVAWTPASDRLASYWGIPMLGMERLGEPRIDPDGALEVFTEPVGWLSSERSGLLVVNFANAARLLRDAAPLRATSAREAQRIQTLITAAPPRVLVPPARPRALT
jgi:hypothetical protein